MLYMCKDKFKFENSMTYFKQGNFDIITANSD